VQQIRIRPRSWEEKVAPNPAGVPVNGSELKINICPEQSRELMVALARGCINLKKSPHFE